MTASFVRGARLWAASRAAARAAARAASRRPRIGLGVGADAIRAVGVRRGVVQWAIELPRDDDTALTVQLIALLARVPRNYAGWPRTSVVAAIGPGLVCTKRLSGFPEVADHRIAAQLVREGASRFFLGSTGPVVTSVGTLGSGDPWAAAFEGLVVDAVAAACDVARLRLEVVVPAVAVLGASVEGDALDWTDGESHVQLRFAQRKLAEIHRAHSAAAEQQHSPFVPALEALGDDRMRFADAYAAATSGPAAWELRAPRADATPAQTSRSRVRGRVAVGLCAVAFAAALLAPALAAGATGRRARAELASIATHRAEAARVHGNLALVTAALAEVASLAQGRRSSLELLAQLTAVLPEGSAITTLRVDSTRGTIVVLTARATEVVSQLDTIGLLVTPEIVGPVTREVISGRELERVTVRFGLAIGGAVAVAERPAASGAFTGVASVPPAPPDPRPRRAP